MRRDDHSLLTIHHSPTVAEALSWLGTPYRHQASVKGVGCDCLGLVRGVWRAVYGSEPEVPPGYTPDWAEAGARETLAEAAGRWMMPVALGEARAGDMLLFRWRDNVPAKHCGILVSAGEAKRFVHAQQGAAVSLATLTPWWRRRVAFVFRFPHVAVMPADAGIQQTTPAVVFTGPSPSRG